MAQKRQLDNLLYELKGRHAQALRDWIDEALDDARVEERDACLMEVEARVVGGTPGHPEKRCRTVAEIAEAIRARGE